MVRGPLVGAVDEGTTSARFIIFRAGTNQIICQHQIEVPSIYPKIGWCEQDPAVIMDTIYQCIELAVKKLEELGGDVKDIITVGVTNQRESTLVWDNKSGRALSNAIIWLDNRTSETIELLLETIPESERSIDYLRAKCGLPLSTYFSGVKLRWLKDNVHEVRRAMSNGDAMFGTIDTWILYNLTGGIEDGVHKTDVTNASRTMLMNIETLRWDDSLLNFFGLPKDILPEICSNAELYGHIKSGPLENVPITACLGDQQAALVGQQCFAEGQAKATYGTGCFLLYNVGERIVHSGHGLLTTVAYQMGRDARVNYALEGSISIAGAAITWLRDQIGLIRSTGQIESMIRNVENTMDVYFVPAFNGLYAPYWNKDARGVICGLSDETKTEHIVRATLEAICFQVCDILDAMYKDCGKPLKKLMVDGGMTVNHQFMQIQADLIGIDVHPASITETTALGAAITAYKAFSTSYDINQRVSLNETSLIFIPRIELVDRLERYRKWHMAVKRSLDWEVSNKERE